MLLTDAIQETNKIFEQSEVKVPEPSPDWKRKIEALEEAKLVNQRAALIFDMRCWQAEQMGFKRIRSNNLVEMLMGSKHTEETSGTERQTYEWIYHHFQDKCFEKSNWGGVPEIFIRKEKRGLWFLPPFSKQEVWRCQFGKLDYLKRQIPYGVVLRILEVKKMKLFNAFNVIAPMEAWIRETDIDPIVVSTIWELPPPMPNQQGESAGQVAHFFLAQWK